MVADTRTVGTTRPFDGFDKLRVCDTAGRLRMTLSGVEWLALAATGKQAGKPAPRLAECES
jgi:hypothetical protein